MENTTISVNSISESFTNSEIVSQLAHCDTNFMIYGDNAGDERLLAQIIHSYSKRSGQPFIPADCKALPEHLLEMNLFGYENTEDKSCSRGLLEYADCGTLFLDEVCDLSLKLQKKLLNVLEGSPFHRVGGSEAIEVRLRIISASTINPVEAMIRGQLNHDFFSQLTLIPCMRVQVVKSYKNEVLVKRSQG